MFKKTFKTFKRYSTIAPQDSSPKYTFGDTYNPKEDNYQNPLRSDKWMVDIGINTKRQEILEEIGELNRRFNTSKYENKMKIKTEKDRKERKEYIDKYNRELKTLFTKLDKLNPSSQITENMEKYDGFHPDYIQSMKRGIKDIKEKQKTQRAKSYGPTSTLPKRGGKGRKTAKKYKRTTAK
jgi:hypothetical protein